MLNVRAEKTPEASVAGAIQATLESWKGLTLVDFSAAESPLYEEAMGKSSMVHFISQCRFFFSSYDLFSMILVTISFSPI